MITIRLRLTFAAAALTQTALAQICETARLVATDPQSNALFATSIALDSDTLVAGAHQADPLVTGPGFRGAVYVFREVAGQWIAESKVPGLPAPATYMGRAVAVHGDVLVASGFSGSAPYERAYAFRRAAGVWTLDGTLVPSDPVSSAAQQPRAVAVDGDRIAVGHPVAGGQPTVAASRTGAVYVYQYTGSWSQTAKLVPTTAATGDQVGLRLAMRAGVLAFSQKPIGPTTVPSAVHVYGFPAGSPSLEATLVATNAGATTSFGAAVATDGVRIAVGDPNDTGSPGNLGAVHVYAKVAGSWVEEQVLRPALPAGASTLFGTQVAIDGDELFATGTGVQVVRFRRVGGVWVEQFEPSPVTGTLSTVTLALGGGTLFVGSSADAVGGLAAAGSLGVHHIGSLAARYGNGLGGSGGLVPTLASSECPIVGAAPTIDVADALGGSAAVLAYAPAATSIPVLGGTLLVAPIVTTQVVLLGGAPGVAGAGGASVPLPVLGPSLLGLELYVQAGVIDPAAPQWFALTNGLRLRIG